MVNFSVWGAELPGIARLVEAVRPKASPQPVTQEISFLEVKALHNLAHERKEQARAALRQYKEMAARAQAMDSAYRAQLGLNRRAA